MHKTFRKALLDALEQTNTKLAAVARATGVSYEQLKKVNQREDASTNVDDAVKVAHFFGQSLDEFLGDTTIEDRSELLDLYSQLSSSEQKFLLDVARARAASGREVG